MQICLGIDGGGSGCRARATDLQGRLLGEGQAGPANILTDPEGAVANIGAAAEQALGGLDPRNCVAVLGLAGANVAADPDRLAKRLPFGRCRILWDGETALTGAFRAGDGSAAIIGTGSVFASRRGGKIRLVGGWGHVLGDEGSGYWLARRFLSGALHAMDGARDVTEAEAALLRDLGGTRGAVAYASGASPAKMAAIVPRVLAAAPEPLLTEADDWVLRMLALLGDDLPVAFLGGLGPHYAARLGDRLGVRLVAPQGSALDGAVWLAQAEAAHG